MPTGHGKSIIVACLAKALTEKDKGKLEVVTMNPYLHYYAQRKYAV